MIQDIFLFLMTSMAQVILLVVRMLPSVGSHEYIENLSKKSLKFN